ncbi:Methyltransferase [Lachnellula hyalina]|uniref:Methyltransferase n=1 Tax=Lachnellula hyalina TaxID=1316788 RepID=A0A8H8TYP8_9HELO|nr:Methyltransferase [Lachnellula hyalina]TVY27399.1 Methyltransferase [Lachnellula hyalina]
MSPAPENHLSASDHVPTDVPTSKRLLDQHTVVIQALGGSLVLAPIDLSKSNLKILDSATADGHWLHELATSHATSHGNRYIGTDINTGFFPKSHGPQYQFYKHNMANAWPLEEHSTFDLVHQRLSLPGAAPASLSQAVQNLFALVKPGGWIQLVEAEQVAPDSGPVFLEFLELVRAVFDTTGAGWKYAGEMRGWLETAGAVDIEEISVDMALGATNKNRELIEIGASSTAGAMTGLIMHAKAMGLKTALTEESLNTLPERLYTELIETGAHYPLRAVWGRKKL